MHIEKEILSGQRWSKDHSWRIAENSLISGSEQYLHVVWDGFKKNSPSSSKNKLQHIQLSYTTGTSNETGFYGQMNKKKKAF